MLIVSLLLWFTWWAVSSLREGDCFFVFLLVLVPSTVMAYNRQLNRLNE